MSWASLYVTACVGACVSIHRDCEVSMCSWMFCLPLGILCDVCEMCAIMTVLSLLGCAPDHGKEEALTLSAVSCLPLIQSHTHYGHCSCVYGWLTNKKCSLAFWCRQLELSLEMSSFYSTYHIQHNLQVTKAI